MKTLIATATAFLVLAIGGSSAMATKGQCDPAPEPYNVQSMTKGNGTVMIEARYGWDGTSIWPECVGPILRIRVTNVGGETWYAHVEGKRGRPRTLTIEPGAARNYSGSQLTNVGIETLADLDELTLTRIP